MVHLQSSYELRCSEILDQLGLHWIRPSHLEYIDDEGLKRKYFPDFFLVDYGIYLDPKNDYLIKKDKTKIDTVRKQNEVSIFVLSKEQLTEESIRSLIDL